MLPGIEYKQYGVFVGGALHWLVETEPYSCLILAFDLMTEDFDELPYPPYEMCVDITKISLGVLGGPLCLVCNYLNDHTHKNYRIDIWIIKEYKVKESWTMLFTVNQEM